jgi:RNA 2',3'-cyclic 3'-phosphodiesterase
VSCVKSRRLFYALWPDAASNAALSRVAETLALPAAARPVRPEDRHITLAFLGTVPEVVRPALAALLEPWPPLTACVLDRLEYWSDAGALVATASQLPADWVDCRSRLVRRLPALGLRVEERPWRPHVTLARGVASDGESRSTALRCVAGRVALVESLSAPGPLRYRTLHAQSVSRCGE